VNDPDKNLTEAERQIRRLEALRQNKDQNYVPSGGNTISAPKTQAAQIEERLRAMRGDLKKASGARKRIKIEGKQKSSKLTFPQIKLLEQIAGRDKSLRGSVVTRIALNRFLNIENSPEEIDLEARINDILRQIKYHS